ncbi:hypothetical protein LCM20_00150 [Halobacillus litoralis]|uniref:hypothetical protein n=1 Tax=Halobacillus litoralis TaxID=45668 RepID=UPI001CD4FC6D|nr:hypothetical protein [Halobacillus litoralis]MCA0968994.1 hypothetical protein [Halobacillus litoralis]
MRRIIVLFIAFTAVLLRITTKKAYAPTSFNSTHRPGDLLFSPVGRRESKYVGHVGIVTTDEHVIHSVPAGLVKDPLEHYYEKFMRRIDVYAPHELEVGHEAALYAESLYKQFPSALYKVNTGLGSTPEIQYCTKVVWQSFYYGAGINLGELPLTLKAVHPILLKRKNQLTKRH